MDPRGVDRRGVAPSAPFPSARHALQWSPVPLDLAPLLDEAFLVADAHRANGALAEARAQFAHDPSAKSFSYEVLVPEDPGRAWFEDRLLARLVYHCESSRSPLPACPGVFVSLFVGERLHCVAADKVVAFACALMDTTPEGLVDRFGTGEVRHPLRGPRALLPGGREG